jgi:D-aminoacyl-tRNA deacylase
MKLLLQKVSSASVDIDSKTTAKIGMGYLIFIGVIKGDIEQNAQKLAKKVSNLRLFTSKDDKKINDRSVLDIEGEILVISQFTLAGDTSKGSRPDYTAAQEPQKAKGLYEIFIDTMRQSGVKSVQTGEFGAYMQVQLTNEGPVTLMLEA